MILESDWHDAKADANLQSHGVSFDLAVTVFRDPSPWIASTIAKITARSVLSSSACRKATLCCLWLTPNVRNAFALFRPVGQPNMSKTTTSGKALSPPRQMTAAAIERAARADRDAQPLTESDIKRMRRTPQAKIIRRALDLTQEEFAARYRIPLIPAPEV